MVNLYLFDTINVTKHRRGEMSQRYHFFHNFNFKVGDVGEGGDEGEEGEVGEIEHNY